MSDLEAQIRMLDLREADKALDDRVLAVLRSDLADGSQALGSPKDVTVMESRGQSQASRQGVVVAATWLLVAVSLLIGIVIGQVLPFARHTQGKPVATSAEDPAPFTEPENDGHYVQQSNENGYGHGNSSASADEIARNGSQVVESLWNSPAAAAARWEQQTGQIFNVATHIKDRRFNMCRDCHRVGG